MVGQGGWLCVCSPESTACLTFLQEGHCYEQESHVQSSRGWDADCACFKLPGSSVTMRPWPPSQKPGEASSRCPLQWSHYRAIADVLADTSARLWISATWKGNLIFFRQISCCYIAVHRGASVVFYGNCTHLRQGHQYRFLRISFFLCRNDQMSSRATLFSQSEATWWSQSLTARVLTSRTTITIMSSVFAESILI